MVKIDCEDRLDRMEPQAGLKLYDMNENLTYETIGRAI
jgi:hypothetical protein